MGQKAKTTDRDSKAVSPAALADILDAHALFAGGRGGARAKLVSCDLSGTDLVNRNLSDAKLSGSTLYGASLRFANLERADLYCADLRNIDARYANFAHADMRGVAMNGSNFAHAKLDHVDFRPGRMARAGLWGIEEIIDRNGSASGVDFSFCSLRGATLENAKLDGANFTGALIHATKFKGARLANASFEGAIFTDVDMGEFHLPSSVLKTCVLPASPEALAKAPHLLARLEAHHRHVESNMLSGWCENFDGEDLRPLGARIGKFKLTAISARRAIAAGVDFSCTELQGADFEGADLRGARFEGADLRGANFSGATLHHAKLTGADMRALQFRSGERRACAFTGTEFTPEQLAEAIRD
jgi:uncharacterized protein YjbI with pentapeptide repeats